MNIMQIVENLYVNTKSTWILEIEEEAEIQPFVIQHFLVMNDVVRAQVRWLDRYVFSLPPRMWLSLAWSVLPKYPKMPFVKFIKKVEDEEEYAFILNEVRKQFVLSDNDYNANRSRILKAIKKDIVEWFKYYGIEKKYWKQYYLDFNLMRGTQIVEPPKVKNLAAWGL